VAESESKPESKPGLGDRIKQMSGSALIVSAVVILVVGLVVGVAAGYEIEHQRVKNDVANAKKEAAKKGTASSSTPQGTANGPAVRLVGKVGTATPDAITLTVGGTTTKKFVTSSKTLVVKAAPGSAADIKPGTRVVWSAVPKEITQAQEIVVLPGSARLGSLVVSTAPDSMTIKSNGNNITVSTKGATIENVTTAKTSDITTGDKLVAQTRQMNASTYSATEVIVLPSASKFVA
jgi:hypothetical protein